MLDFESSTSSSIGQNTLYTAVKAVLQTLDLNELPEYEEEGLIEEPLFEDEGFLGLMASSGPATPPP